jgi:hypothetical protein
MDIQGRWLRQVFTSRRAESFVAKGEPGHIMSVESHPLKYIDADILDPAKTLTRQ